MASQIASQLERVGTFGKLKFYFVSLTIVNVPHSLVLIQFECYRLTVTLDCRLINAKFVLQTRNCISWTSEVQSLNHNHLLAMSHWTDLNLSDEGESPN